MFGCVFYKVAIWNVPSSFLYSNPELFTTKFFGTNKKWKYLNKHKYNLSVNYQSNFEFAEEMFKKYGNEVRLSSIIQEIEANKNYLEMIEQKWLLSH